MLLNYKRNGRFHNDKHYGSHYRDFSGMPLVLSSEISIFHAPNRGFRNPRTNSEVRPTSSPAGTTGHNPAIQVMVHIHVGLFYLTNSSFGHSFGYEPDHLHSVHEAHEHGFSDAACEAKLLATL